LVDLIERLRVGESSDMQTLIDNVSDSAASDQLQVFVGDLNGGYALRILAVAFGRSDCKAFSAIKSVQEGWFVIRSDMFPENSLERLLAHRPLYYSWSSLPKWAVQSPPSLATLRTTTDDIVAECQKAGMAMNRSDFAAELAKRTGTTKRQAIVAYWPLTPKHWRRRGPKGPRSGGGRRRS
jgi:hypothetical protein